MFYIPKEWLKNKDNDQKVHDILDKYLVSDLNLDTGPVIKGLKEIGETTVIEKIKDGTIII